MACNLAVTIEEKCCLNTMASELKSKRIALESLRKQALIEQFQVFQSPNKTSGATGSTSSKKKLIQTQEKAKQFFIADKAKRNLENSNRKRPLDVEESSTNGYNRIPFNGTTKNIGCTPSPRKKLYVHFGADNDSPTINYSANTTNIKANLKETTQVKSLKAARAKKIDDNIKADSYAPLPSSKFSKVQKSIWDAIINNNVEGLEGNCYFCSFGGFKLFSSDSSYFLRFSHVKYIIHFKVFPKQSCSNNSVLPPSSETINAVICKRYSELFALHTSIISVLTANEASNLLCKEVIATLNGMFPEKAWLVSLPMDMNKPASWISSLFNSTNEEELISSEIFHSERQTRLHNWMEYLLELISTEFVHHKHNSKAFYPKIIRIDKEALEKILDLIVVFLSN